MDPLQADLVAQIINLKNLSAATTSPEDFAGIMSEIQDLEQQLAALQGSVPSPANTVPPPVPEPNSSVDPAQADLMAQIINLKNLSAVTTSPEELAGIMGKIQDLEQQLAVLQGSIPSSANTVPPPVPAPNSSVDPAQADLMAQIINLKNLSAVTTSPEELAGIMGKIQDLEQQLAVLQGSIAPPGNTVPPPTPEPNPPLDPVQAALMAQIIALKNSFPSAAAPDDPIAIWNKIMELERQLEALREANPPSANAAPPVKPDPAQTGDSAPANAAGARKGKLSIASNQNGQANAPAQGNQITIFWNGGPGIILQTAGSFGPAGWQDVPDTEGKNSVDLPISTTGTFFRAVKR